MKNPKKTFIARLTALRPQQGLTQTALAKQAGISREYLARLEKGVQDPTLGTMTQLAKALKVTVVELLQ